MLDEEIIKSILSKRLKTPSNFFTILDINNLLDSEILGGYINVDYSIKNKNYIHISTIKADEYKLELRKIKIRKLFNINNRNFF